MTTPSNNDNIITPKYITDALGPFDLDPCAGQNTNIATINIWIGNGQNHDGLSQNCIWNGFVWCNPPFSQKQQWANKMIEHNNGILLLPERGSAPWFGPLTQFTYNGMFFILGKKISFIGGTNNGNNIGSVLFPFGPEAVERIKKSNLPGTLVQTVSFTPRP